MIEFINAMSVPMVAFTLVVLGAIAAVIISVLVFKGNKEKQKLNHQEAMVKLETNHREVMVKIKSNDPKLIEG